MNGEQDRKKNDCMWFEIQSFKLAIITYLTIDLSLDPGKYEIKQNVSAWC